MVGEWCVCVCVGGAVSDIHVNYILDYNASRKKTILKSVLTYEVDVRNVVFLNSDCLLKEVEFKICFTTLHSPHTALSRRVCIMMKAV